MAPSAIRGPNAGWLLSSPGDIGIIGGASAFNGLALAVARCGRSTVVMKVNVSKPPTRPRKVARVCREAEPPPSSSFPR